MYITNVRFGELSHCPAHLTNFYFKKSNLSGISLGLEAKKYLYSIQYRFSIMVENCIYSYIITYILAASCPWDMKSCLPNYMT